MSVIQIDLSVTELIQKEPTIIVSKLFFLLVRVVTSLDFLLSALLIDASIVRFYKVVVATLKSVIVLNNMNFEVGSIRHSAMTPACTSWSGSVFTTLLKTRGI